MAHCTAFIGLISIIGLTMSESSYSSSVWSETNYSESESSQTIIECCICLDSTSSFLNESEFIKAFGFYCRHSSNNVCIDCWNRLLYRHGNKTKCPLCRACKLSETGPNLPYGLADDDDENIGSQPGYDSQQNRSMLSRIRQRIDLKNGLIGQYLRNTFESMKCMFCNWDLPKTRANAFECAMCCPAFTVIAVTCSAIRCAETTLVLTISCCCCFDCWHCCFPQWKCRSKCKDWLIDSISDDEYE